MPINTPAFTSRPWVGTQGFSAAQHSFAKSFPNVNTLQVTPKGERFLWISKRTDDRGGFSAGNLLPFCMCLRVCVSVYTYLSPGEGLISRV